MQTSEILNRAADLIEERGWQQGGNGWGFRDGEPLCLEGGILAALGTNFREVRMRDWLTNCPAYSAVASYLGRPRPEPVASGLGSDCQLWSFNDERGRTAPEVIEVLRACAVIEASRERELVTA